MAGINTLDRDTLVRRMAQLQDRIARLEQFLSGVPVGTARIADAAITNAKIDSFTFDKGQGGTLTLGGNANINGVLSILDGSGVQKGYWDKDGIIIRDGKLSIENDGGSVTIDGEGIRSTTNFTTSAASNAGGLNQEITATSNTDITGASLTFSLSRTALLLILVDVSMFMNDTSSTQDYVADAYVHLNIDSDVQSQELVERGGIYQNGDGDRLGIGETVAISTAMHRLQSLSSGSHTIKLQARLSNILNTTKLYINRYRLTYIILGT